MKPTSIPDPTVRRLSLYLRELETLWRSDHRVGYAPALTVAQRDSLHRAGYRVREWAGGGAGGR